MPATTTPLDDRRSRLERILALARLSLAVLAALVLRIDPLAVVTALPALPSLIMAYTLYAWAAAVAVAVVTRDLQPLGVILQCLDVGWAVLITSITAGPADAFFVFFVFVVVGAAYRWGFKESLATGLVTAALLLGQSALASAGYTMLPAAGLWAHVVVRAGYAVGLAVLIGYLAEEQHRARAESAAAARVLAAVNLGSGLRASIDAMLRELMDTFQARAALLAFEEVGAGRLYLWELPERGGSVRLIERPLDANSRIAGRFRSGARVYRLRTRSPAVEMTDDRGRRRADTELPSRIWEGESRVLLVGEMPIGDAWAGRLALVDPKSPTTARTRQWLAGLLPQAGLALYSLYLLGRLRSKVTAIERSHLARELHDGVIQSLVALDMHIEVLRRKLEAQQSEATEPLTQIQKQLREEVINVRELMQQIRPVPVDSKDIVGHLMDLAERFRRDTSIDARFATDLTDVSLAPRQARELVRIVQEALVNIRKHSGARTVVLRLAAADDGLVLTVDDDGRGFQFEGRLNLDELDAARRGPVVIKERVRVLGGTMRIDSAPGRGSRLEIFVPRRTA